MPWIHVPLISSYAQAPAVDFSPQNSSDGEPSAPLRMTHTVNASSSPDSRMDASNRAPFGMTSKLSTGDPGVDAWISSLRAFHASHFRSPGKNAENRTLATSGQMLCESFAKWNRVSSGWKMCQDLLPLDISEPSSAISWPRAGEISGGACYRRQSWERPISDADSGYWPVLMGPSNGGSRGKRKSRRALWPTPAARDWRSGKASRQTLESNARPLNEIVIAGIASGLAAETTKTKGSLDPAFGEYLMGWPHGWTACDVSAMDRFRLWVREHSDV